MVHKKWVKQVLTPAELEKFEKYFKWYKIWSSKPEEYKVRNKKGKIRTRTRWIRVSKTYAYFWNVELMITNPNWKPNEEWVLNNKYKGSGLHFRHKTHSYFQKRKEKDANTKASTRANTKKRTRSLRKQRRD